MHEACNMSVIFCLPVKRCGQVCGLWKMSPSRDRLGMFNASHLTLLRATARYFVTPAMQWPFRLYKPLMFLQSTTHCSEEKVFSLSNLRELFTKNVSLQCRNTFLMTWPYCVQSLASSAKEFNNIVYYGGCSVIKEMDYGQWQLYNCHLKFKQYVVQTLKQFGYLWFIIHSLLKCHWNVIHCNH